MLRLMVSWRLKVLSLGLGLLMLCLGWRCGWVGGREGDLHAEAYGVPRETECTREVPRVPLKLD
ncbi:hypothetical protein J7L06_03670 [Candidatus Bathyarchaeota archaeon]|nr:hypothetical protein [Candidatus Bathyarchaeota archaeon]